MSIPSSSANNGSTAAAAPECIRVRGARVHNLRNVDVDIPRDKLVVITGPSGSGKSSLALDTLYAEGQRQYIESLSVYARQFLHQLERPDVDLVEGLQPTLCIDQRSGSQNPRSTVATVTEIYDHLRLLMARVGQAECYGCGAPVRPQTPEQIQDNVQRMPEGTKLMLLAPLVRGRKGKHQDVLAAVRKAGFVRVRVDSVVHDIDNVPELSPRKMHTIEAVVDRIIIRPGLQSRLAESIRTALRYGEGSLLTCHLDTESSDDVHPDGTWRDELYSTQSACTKCGISFEQVEPRTFSFNSPYGACAVCEGLGVCVEFDTDLVLPDPSLSLDDGAIDPWKGATSSQQKKYRDELASFMTHHKVEWHTSLREWKRNAVDKLLLGDGKRFLGVLMLLEKEFATTTKKNRLAQLENYRGDVACRSCNGARLRPEARNVRVAGRAIQDITSLTVADARQFFESQEWDEGQAPIAKPIVRELVGRLRFLEKVGVEYLSLDRAADTLSGGELQRVRLATSIGSGLVRVCYVLDEPSIGLHQRDNDRLIKALRDLQQQGNTVLVVEHDESMMRQADFLVDMGPGAGANGGRIVSLGSPEDVQRDPASLTGRYMAGHESIPIPARRRRIAKSRSMTMQGVCTNNLQDITVQIPLGAFVCVTGVSGSGKSSLVNDTLAPALLRRLGADTTRPGPFTSLRGTGQIDKLVVIDQSPIGRTPRSNPATYTGMFDEIRKVFKETREARQLGYGVSRFSFNVKGGRCEECQGQGVQKIEMSFLPDMYVQCNVCDGARFNRQTLQVRYRGKSIADVLGMRVDEASAFFESFPIVHRLLESVRDVGLGYMALGQPSTTLSGGEAQRIKLATQLARVDTAKTMYVLDEPTTGLHADDIRKLLDVLGRLVDKGNSVVVIEHNLDVIKCADWLIDLGPEGGDAGGCVVAVGSPEEVAAIEASHTGRFLKPLLNGKLGS